MPNIFTECSYEEDGKKKKKEEKKNNVSLHVSFHERMAGQEWNSGKPCTN
jgi:hypothetical protein